jgi:hypothetical protein
LPPVSVPTPRRTTARVSEIRGPYTIDWVNLAPFFLDVKDADGTVLNWASISGSPLEMERDGWKKSSLHIGDVVTVEGNPSRARYGSQQTVVLNSIGSDYAPPAALLAGAAPAPRWPDGQLKLGGPGKRIGGKLSRSGGKQGAKFR